MQQYIESIDKDGYCIIPQLYSSQRIAEALKRIKHWHEISRDQQSDKVPFLNRATPLVYNLQSKDFFFIDLLFEHSVVQQILIHFLNDRWFKQIPPEEPNYILRSYMARSSQAALPMHIDSFIPYVGPHTISMQIVIALEDASAENGSTLLVPGSHQTGQYCTQEARDRAISTTTKAGDVVIWDSRIWHGATENRSGRTRWAIIATFARWWLKQFFNITQSLPQQCYERLTDSQKAVMGFCSVPNYDETHGIDMKCGYDALLPHVADYHEPVLSRQRS